VLTRVAEVELVHSARQRTVLDGEQEVVMVAHQAVRDALPLDLDRRLCEPTDEVHPVDVVSEKSLRNPDGVRVHVEDPCAHVAMCPWHISPRLRPRATGASNFYEGDTFSYQSRIGTWYRPFRITSARVEAIVVEVVRNGVVEARHRVHAVAVRDGAVVAEAGDAGLTCFMRSSSKPLQALPLVRARDDLTTEDIAIACASHRATPAQIAAVEALLAKAPATEDDLENGIQEGRTPRKLFHNCSGKHAGMLALARHNGWPTAGYRLPDHPVQQAARQAHAEAADVDADELQTATDGCGVVTFALPLERMAYAFARFPSLPGADRITHAMRAHPDLVGGPGGVDEQLMRDGEAARWFAKGGAEGLLCAGTETGLGIALKSEDGASRPHGPALAHFLAPLGTDLPNLAATPLTNSRGEPVGELRVVTSS
jgi:L-asparaginase II